MISKLTMQIETIEPLLRLITQILLSIGIVGVYLVKIVQDAPIDPTLQNIVLGLLGFWLGTGAIGAYVQAQRIKSSENGANKQ